MRRRRPPGRPGTAKGIRKRAKPHLPDPPASQAPRSGEEPARRNEPDRLDWADPLTDEERQALEAGWGFVE